MRAFQNNERLRWLLVVLLGFLVSFLFSGWEYPSLPDDSRAFQAKVIKVLPDKISVMPLF